MAVYIMIRNAAIVILCLALGACSKSPKIKLAYNQPSVIVSGLDAVTLGGLKRDTLNQQAWQSLFPVRKMPADAELKDDQPPLNGKYSVSDHDVVFTPDTPFIKGVTYFARYYRYDEKISNWDLIFRRRKLAQAEYAEETFVP